MPARPRGPKSTIPRTVTSVTPCLGQSTSWTRCGWVGHFQDTPTGQPCSYVGMLVGLLQVSGLGRRGSHERTEKLNKQAREILGQLVVLAARQPRNYIIDQVGLLSYQIVCQCVTMDTSPFRTMSTTPLAARKCLSLRVLRRRLVSALCRLRSVGDVSEGGRTTVRSLYMCCATCKVSIMSWCLVTFM